MLRNKDTPKERDGFIKAALNVADQCGNEIGTGESKQSRQLLEEVERQLEQVNLLKGWVEEETSNTREDRSAGPAKKRKVGDFGPERESTEQKSGSVNKNGNTAHHAMPPGQGPMQKGGLSPRCRISTATATSVETVPSTTKDGQLREYNTTQEGEKRKAAEHSTGRKVEDFDFFHGNANMEKFSGNGDKPNERKADSPLTKKMGKVIIDL